MGTQRLAAAGVASSLLLSGSWVMAAQAAGTPDTSCVEAVRLADEMTDVNSRRIGTMGAQSAAVRLGMGDKAAALTSKHRVLATEYEVLYMDFRAASARCR